jgi:hypothetical protein
MTSKRFQSGHEVLSHFVPSYDASRPLVRQYNERSGRLLSGERLGGALLEDLKQALAGIGTKRAQDSENEGPLAGQNDMPTDSVADGSKDQPNV